MGGGDARALTAQERIIVGTVIRNYGALGGHTRDRSGAAAVDEPCAALASDGRIPVFTVRSLRF